VIIVRIAMNALPENQKEVMQTLLSMIESTEKERGWADDLIQFIRSKVITGKNITT